MVGKIMFSRVLQNRATSNPQSNQPASRIEAPAMDNRKSYSSYSQGRDDRFDVREDRTDRMDGKSDGNKIRRGPGRRIAKEKQRLRNMDPALQQKYASLPASLQEKVNAAIEICYQQHMANLYKNPSVGSNQDASDHDHYEDDVEVDADTPSL